MVIVQEKKLEHIVLPNISWETYERLLAEVGESHVRLTYDDGDLEIMTLSFGHENVASWIGRLAFFVALELKIPLCSGGSTTFKKSLKKKGLEADECFWIAHELAMRGKKDWDEQTDPPPDLAIEVDITSSSLDRLGIYAALAVPEIWHYNGTTFKVLILGARGKYKEKSSSLAFPSLPVTEFANFVDKLGTADEITLIQAFVDWLRADVVPKQAGAS